ncbi:hypothetical protein, partial [Bacteroides sp.]|uniref:hypothetical protein n=1 Tax=Bacteroides sp. TaxID=29523 RepID=UPI002585E723
GDLRVTNALLYQLSYSGSDFSFTGCKITPFFEITKRKRFFFEKIFLKMVFYICSVIFPSKIIVLSI